jgi:hypothetical protein
VTIDKVGPKPPKTDGLSETSEPRTPEKPSSAPGAGFKQALESAPAADRIADRLDSIIQDAASRLRQGEITKDQALDFIVDQLKKDLLQGPLPPEEIESAVAFVREIMTDDPAVDLLLRGK